MPNVATTSVKLPVELKERVARLAKAADQTVHAYLVAAIEEQTRQQEKNEKFAADSDAALEETLRTGKGYAAKDVRRYLLARAAGKKVARPKLKSWRR